MFDTVKGYDRGILSITREHRENTETQSHYKEFVIIVQSVVMQP
jgi:hypothetical protein